VCFTSGDEFVLLTHPTRGRPTHRAPAIIALMLATGCESQDARLADYAERAREQQVRQNERMAEQSQAVVQQSERLTSAAQQLVEQDAVARRDLLQASQQLSQQNQAERAALNRQQAQLAADRQSAAVAALRQPLIAEAVLTTGLILAVLLPLLVTAYALRRLPEKDPAEQLLVEHVWDELISERAADHLSAPTFPALTAGDPPRLGDDKGLPLDAPSAGV
jgi:hypothetical protein